MDQKHYYYFGGFLLLFVLFLFAVFSGLSKEDKNFETIRFHATVMAVSNNQVTVQDENNLIYTFLSPNVIAEVGKEVAIEYTGLLDKSREVQKGTLVDIEEVSMDDVPQKISENGIFSNYRKLAQNKLDKMNLEEKIAQLLLVRYPNQNAIELLKKYPFAGYVFYEKDFQGKDEKEIQTLMRNLQKASSIPILTATDEEGGEVVRLSSNKNLREEPFKSPKELYDEGSFEAIQKDTIEKSSFLSNLGINVNLGPVVDVSTSPSDYIYNRTLGEDTEKTAQYAETVIGASKATKVSYVLKHFPGYGNNADTHTKAVTDNRSYEDIKKNDLPPFEAGIKKQAEAILVSHNTVANIDSSNPASLSASVHNVLRGDLDFSGIIMTDDLAMKATSEIDDVYVKALLAGNDILMVTDYDTAMKEIKEAVNSKRISEDLINNANLRILSWKYYKGLMFENQK